MLVRMEIVVRVGRVCDALVNGLLNHVNNGPRIHDFCAPPKFLISDSRTYPVHGQTRGQF